MGDLGPFGHEGGGLGAGDCLGEGVLDADGGGQAAGGVAVGARVVGGD